MAKAKVAETETEGTGKILSIQGEQQVAVQDTIWATEAEVEQFVSTADDGVLACRERGRHQFPPTRSAHMTFHRITREGFYERRVPCDSCRRPDGTPRVVRLEVWDVKHKRDKIIRCELVSSRPDYVDPSYLNTPGHGRMKPKQIRGAAGTEQLAGQSLTALRKEILAEEERRAQELRETYLKARNAQAEQERAQLTVVDSA